MRKPILLAVGSAILVALPAVAQMQMKYTQTPMGGTEVVAPVGTPIAPGGVATPYGYSNPYQTTTGFYNPTMGNINYPSFGAPISLGGSYYNVPSGNTRLPMWRAPSGYYYPWCPRPTGFVYAYPMPVLVINQQQTSPAPALPPLSTVMGDMEKYLDDSKKDGKISERDFTNMSRRVKDLKSKERTLRIAGGGTLDPADETQLRTDVDKVGSELTWRLNR